MIAAARETREDYDTQVQMAIKQAIAQLPRIWSSRWSYFVRTAIGLATYALLVWALIVYGEENLYQNTCEDRLSGSGFEGNSDFYGLGIRLGLYLTWIATALGGLMIKSDWRGLQVSYNLFSIALVVAMLIITFRRQCTYTAEFIIFLFLWWGGSLCVSLSTASRKVDWDVVTTTAIRRSRRWYQPNTLDMMQTYFLGAMTIFSCWFWIRLVTKGEADFAPSPSGTRYFLFSRVNVDNKAAAGFMIFLSLLYGVGIVTIVIQRYLHARKLRKGRKTSSDPDADDDESNKSTLLFSITLLLFSLVYTVLAVEFTIVWNNVTGVYDLASTGQVIPLVIGGGMVISTLWRLKPKELSGVEDDGQTLAVNVWTTFETDEDFSIKLAPNHVEEAEPVKKEKHTNKLESKVKDFFGHGSRAKLIADDKEK